MSSNKKDLNEKFISFLDQVKDEPHKSVTHLNDRVLVIDGLNTFIRAFAVNPAINDDGLHIGGMMGFLKSIRYTCDILKPSRCVIVFDGKGGSKRRSKIYPEYKATRKVKKRLNRNVDWGTAPQDEQESMIQQMGRLIEYLEQLPLTLVCIDGIEADDGIAYISQQLLSESDFVKRLAADDKKASNVIISEIMSSNFRWVEPKTELEDAIQKMLNNNIRRLVILDDNKLVGVITQTDLTGFLRDKLLVDKTIKNIQKN